MIEPVYSFGLLALELCPGQHLSSAQVSVARSEQLGSLLAEDLRSWIGPHTAIDISLAGAAFDPVEILRPGWPVHAEIARLTHLAPKSSTSRLLCFGSAEGRMPEGLQPDPAHAQGPLRWLPFVLSGPVEQIRAVQDGMEAELMERGMAGAATALYAQEAFAAEPAAPPPLKLEPVPAKKTRKPSPQEQIARRLEGQRAQSLGPAALPDTYGVSRLNQMLEPLTQVAPEVLDRAHGLYLDDEYPGTRDPPWPLALFVSQWGRWVSMAAREMEAVSA